MGPVGITEPISLSGPSEFDVIKTQELEKVYTCSFFVFLVFSVTSWMNSCSFLGYFFFPF